MVVGTHETGQFFPWAHGFVLLVGLTGFALAMAREIHLPMAAAIIVIAATSYRLFVYLWPASMIGVDPDGYAAVLHQVIELGTTSAAPGISATYGTLSIIYMFNGIGAIVTGLRGRAVLIGVPLAMGVLLPLGAIVLSRRIGTNNSLSVLAGTLGAVAGIGILYSYWPIAQVLASLVWVPLLILLIIAADVGDPRAITGAVVCLPALIYAHKISLLVPTAIVGAAIITHLAEKRLAVVMRTPHNRDYIHLFGIFFVLIGVIFALQWLYITKFLRSAAFIIAPFAGGQTEAIPTSPQFATAAPGLPKISGILARRAHYLPLIPLVTVAGFVLWLRDKSTPTLLLVAASAVPILFISIAIIGPNIAPPRRMLLFGIVPFVVVLTRFAQELPQLVSADRAIVFTVLFVPVLLLQAGTVPAAPDYPDQPRYYLSAGEVQAKSFMMDNSVDPVAMDWYYASMRVDVSSISIAPRGEGERSSGIISLDQRLLNASLENGEYDAVLLRQNVDVIRFPRGLYRLLWDPIYALSTNNDYSKVYDNGHSVGFSKLSSNRS
jgi:hypothetical protein